jgi:hypothetical protein
MSIFFLMLIDTNNFPIIHILYMNQLLSNLYKYIFHRYEKIVVRY